MTVVRVFHGRMKFELDLREYTFILRKSNLLRN